MKKIANFICKHKILILIITLILCIPILIGYLNTKINYDILVYLPKDIETLKGEKILTDDFHMGAYSIVIVDNMSAKQILELEDKYREIDTVEKVVSINDITGTTIPDSMLPSVISKKVVSGKSKLILVTFRNSTSDDKTLEAVEKMRNISNEHIKIGGMSAMVLDIKDLFNNEMIIYVIVAGILCTIVLELFLDSYLVPILLMANIALAILFNMGSNIIFGEISYITKAIAAVLQLGVTTDFSIFLYHKYEALKKKYEDKNEAMSEAIVDTFISVFGSSLTTIAGFLALCTMNLTLGADIGIVMAKGVVLGVISVLTVFPSLLLLFDKQIDKTTHKVIVPHFTRIKEFVMKHYKYIFIGFIILLIPFYLFQANTKVYYKLDKSIPETYGYSIATKALQEDFKLGTQEMILIDKNMMSYEINNMIKEIEKVDGISKVLSSSILTDYGINEEHLNDDIKNIYQTDKYKMLLVSSEYDVATDELNDQVTLVNDIIKKYDENAIFAGEGPLMKDLVSTTKQDLINVNYTSILIIFIIMLIVLKSLSLPILLITAIEFAIFINMGIPYLRGTTLPFIASIVIGTIQLGATIDYAILLTTKYLDERKTKDKEEAVKIALDSSISSIFVSAMCFFAATVGVGIVSKIDMIESLCILMCRGAIISMFVVILIVPSILIIFDKYIIKTTKGFKERRINMNKKTKLTLLLLLLIPFNINAAKKNETVYQRVDNKGNVVETIVTEELSNISGDIIDETDLDNILNLNGEETYKKDGNKIIWNSKGKNIFYQGTSNKKLPIDINIKYYLDGEYKNVIDLDGKKGHIKIRINYKNLERHGDLYTPFVVGMGTILNNEYNSNIIINTGKVVSNGKQSIIIGLATPNLSDSLGIDELDELNYLEIEYDTTNFEQNDIYNVYSPKILDLNDLKIFNKLDEIYGKVNKLSSNSTKLVKGAKKLKKGVNTYTDSFNTYKNGVNTLNSGIKTAKNSYTEINNGLTTVSYGIDGLSTLANGLTQLKTGIDELITGTNQLLSGVSDGKAGVTQLKSGMSAIGASTTAITNYNTGALNGINGLIQNYCNIDATLCTTLNQIKVALTNEKTVIDTGFVHEDTQIPALTTTINSVKNGLNNLDNGLTLINNGLLQIKQGLETIKTNLDDMDLSGLDELQNGVKKLAQGSDKFNNGLTTIKDSTNKINDATNSLYDASVKINKGTKELATNLEKFDIEGIKVIANFVNGDLKKFENNLKELQRLGDDYDTFTRKNYKMNGETKFIVKIEAN